jgi:hypothetical protein
MFYQGEVFTEPLLFNYITRGWYLTVIDWQRVEVFMILNIKV